MSLSYKEDCENLWSRTISEWSISPIGCNYLKTPTNRVTGGEGNCYLLQQLLTFLVWLRIPEFVESSHGLRSWNKKVSFKFKSYPSIGKHVSKLSSMSADCLNIQYFPQRNVLKIYRIVVYFVISTLEIIW